MNVSFILTILLSLNNVDRLNSSNVDAINEAWQLFKDGVQCIAKTKIPTENDVKFLLLSPATEGKSERVTDPAKSTGFNKSLETKVLIHGYTQSPKNELFLILRHVYKQTHILNIIVVDWEPLASSPCYPVAVDYTSFVGQLTGYMIKRIPAEKTHVIGYSLGAHIAGMAGQINEGRILRITGLDPPHLMFPKILNNKRLDNTDAQNVDIIHTSVLGSAYPIGHADFFVNGGKVQPGCSTADVACSHKKSLELYINSINSNVGFRGISCKCVNNTSLNKCENSTFSLMGEPWFASCMGGGLSRTLTYRNILGPNIDDIMVEFLENPPWYPSLEVEQASSTSVSAISNEEDTPHDDGDEETSSQHTWLDYTSENSNEDVTDEPESDTRTEIQESKYDVAIQKTESEKSTKYNKRGIKNAHPSSRKDTDLKEKKPNRIEPDNRKQGTSVQKTNKTNKTAVAAVKRDDVNERGAKNTIANNEVRTSNKHNTNIKNEKTSSRKSLSGSSNKSDVESSASLKESVPQCKCNSLICRCKEIQDGDLLDITKSIKHFISSQLGKLHDDSDEAVQTETQRNAPNDNKIYTVAQADKTDFDNTYSTITCGSRSSHMSGHQSKTETALPTQSERTGKRRALSNIAVQKEEVDGVFPRNDVLSKRSAYVCSALPGQTYRDSGLYVAEARSSQLHQMQYDNENIQESTELIEEGTLPAKITYEKNDFQSSSDRLEKAEDSIHGRKLFRRFSDVILDEEGFLIDDESFDNVEDRRDDYEDRSSEKNTTIVGLSQLGTGRKKDELTYEEIQRRTRPLSERHEKLMELWDSIETLNMKGEEEEEEEIAVTYWDTKEDGRLEDQDENRGDKFENQADTSSENSNCDDSVINQNLTSSSSDSSEVSSTASERALAQLLKRQFGKLLTRILYPKPRDHRRIERATTSSTTRSHDVKDKSLSVQQHAKLKFRPTVSVIKVDAPSASKESIRVKETSALRDMSDVKPKQLTRVSNRRVSKKIKKKIKQANEELFGPSTSNE